MAIFRSNMVIDFLRRPARSSLAAYRRHRLVQATDDFDALLVSYPKSGRTWLRFILANYFALVIDQGHRVDLHTMFAFLPNLAWDRVRGVEATLKRELKDARMPLIAVTHDPTSVVLGKQLPILFKIRDPRDVMVSSYFHATRHRHRFEGDIDAFVRDDAQGLPHLVRYLNRSVELLASRPHHIVSYEQLSKQPIVVVAAVLRFLEHDADLKRVEQAIENAVIDKMRAIEVEQGIPAHEYDRTDPDAMRARRGVVGGFSDYLSRDTQHWIEQFCASKLSADAVRLVEHNSQIALVGGK